MERRPPCALAEIAKQFDKADNPEELRDVRARNCGRCALKPYDWVQIQVRDWDRGDGMDAQPEVVISSQQMFDNCQAKAELPLESRDVNIRYQ